MISRDARLKVDYGSLIDNYDETAATCGPLRVNPLGCAGAIELRRRRYLIARPQDCAPAMHTSGGGDSNDRDQG